MTPVKRVSSARSRKPRPLGISPAHTRVLQRLPQGCAWARRPLLCSPRRSLGSVSCCSDCRYSPLVFTLPFGTSPSFLAVYPSRGAQERLPVPFALRSVRLLLCRALGRQPRMFISSLVSLTRFFAPSPHESLLYSLHSSSISFSHFTEYSQIRKKRFVSQE